MYECQAKKVRETVCLQEIELQVSHNTESTIWAFSTATDLDLLPVSVKVELAKKPPRLTIISCRPRSNRGLVDRVKIIQHISTIAQPGFDPSPQADNCIINEFPKTGYEIALNSTPQIFVIERSTAGDPFVPSRMTTQKLDGLLLSLCNRFHVERWCVARSSRFSGGCPHGPCEGL